MQCVPVAVVVAVGVIFSDVQKPINRGRILATFNYTLAVDE